MESLLPESTREGETREKFFGGEWRIRTTEGDSQQIYSLPRLTAPETPHKIGK